MKAILRMTIGLLLAVSLTPVKGSDEPHILVDTAHGGYPAKDGRLTEFVDLAAEKGITVEIQSMDKVNLSDYCLVLSANPDLPFSSQEANLLSTYLREGGTFFLTGAGDFENRDHSEVTNQLLEAFSTIRFNDDQLQDSTNAGRPYIPIFKEWNLHPLTESLPPISLYSPESITPGKAYPLLYGNATTISQDTDGNTRVPAGIVLLAVERVGEGDLLVGGSWGFLSGFSFEGHQEFAARLLDFVKEKATISTYREAFQGATIVIGEKCRPEVDRKGAEVLAALLHGEINSHSSQRTVIIGGPRVNPLFAQINPYLPIKMENRQPSLVVGGQTFSGQEYGVIAVVTKDHRRILVVAGLGGTGTMGGVILLEHLGEYPLPLTYNEYGEAVLFRVLGDLNLNGLEDGNEKWEITFL